jgi:hypothetical protein
MEFLRVWRGLSPGQRGYLFGPIALGWIGTVVAIGSISEGSDVESPLWVAGAGILFSLILYVSVRKKALMADSQDCEMDNQLHWRANGRRIPQLPGSPKYVVWAVGLAGPISAFLLLPQGVLLSLVALVVFGLLCKYLATCAHKLGEPTRVRRSRSGLRRDL